MVNRDIRNRGPRLSLLAWRYHASNQQVLDYDPDEPSTPKTSDDGQRSSTKQNAEAITFTDDVSSMNSKVGCFEGANEESAAHIGEKATSSRPAWRDRQAQSSQTRPFCTGYMGAGVRVERQSNEQGKDDHRKVTIGRYDFAGITAMLCISPIRSTVNPLENDEQHWRDWPLLYFGPTANHHSQLQCHYQSPSRHSLLATSDRNDVRGRRCDYDFDSN
ncbi:hypothetical protein LTR27_005638 [Elasticomyces elasticus]|nr:hypothetical protein LTR27_005638 [Elasticomyces elasticus]